MSYESARCECCRRRVGVRSVCGIWCCATCAEAELELEMERVGTILPRVLAPLLDGREPSRVA